MRFRWSSWRFGGVGGALTGVRCVWKVVVEAFLGVLWRFDVCIGRFRGVRLVLGVFGR